ncbi:MAG: hypothetical protein JWN48_3930 [Myxococcaceae bacterium]|nr:hypothetical protein [Myxococcaceae bacterium]
MSRHLAAAGALLLATLSTTPTQAEQTEALAPGAPLLVRLAPTAESVAHARKLALEGRLARALASWPEIARAEVMLALPSAAEAALDRPLPDSRATVVLTRRSRGLTAPSAPPPSGPSEVEIVRLLSAAVPGFMARDLTLLEHVEPAASTPPVAHPLVAVGPFRVAEESAFALRGALALSLAMHAFFAAIVLWRLRQNRPGVRKVDPRARSPFPP